MVVCIIILVYGGEKRLIYGVWWLEFAEKVVGKMLIGQYEHSIDAKGRMKVFYVNEEIGGFAVHFVK